MERGEWISSRDCLLLEFLGDVDSWMRTHVIPNSPCHILPLPNYFLWKDCWFIQKLWLWGFRVWLLWNQLFFLRRLECFWVLVQIEISHWDFILSLHQVREDIFRTLRLVLKLSCSILLGQFRHRLLLILEVRMEVLVWCWVLFVLHSAGLRSDSFECWLTFCRVFFPSLSQSSLALEGVHMLIEVSWVLASR